MFMVMVTLVIMNCSIKVTLASLAIWKSKVSFGTFVAIISDNIGFASTFSSS